MSCQLSLVNSKSHLILLGSGTIAIGAIIGYIIGIRSKKCNVINYSIKKKTDKVVDIVDIEDLGNKNTLCRCWKSKEFPYCDGSHNKHNIDSNDNVGPIIIKQKEE